MNEKEKRKFYMVSANISYCGRPTNLNQIVSKLELDFNLELSYMYIGTNLIVINQSLVNIVVTVRLDLRIKTQSKQNQNQEEEAAKKD